MLGLSVYAFDNYFSGNLTDALAGMAYTPAAPRYFATGVTVPAGGSSTLAVPRTRRRTVSPSQSGLLLMYRDARQQREADPITITRKPVLSFVKGGLPPRIKNAASSPPLS